MTLSMGVSAWCQKNQAAVSPDFISDVLMNLAKMRLKPTVLLRLFEDKFGENLTVFSDEVGERGRSHAEQAEAAEGVRHDALPEPARDQLPSGAAGAGGSDHVEQGRSEEEAKPRTPSRCCGVFRKSPPRDRCNVFVK